MNIQIFGTKKSSDTRKAERFFKERGIRFQSVDMKEKGLSKGEFQSVMQAVGGLEAMIDENCKDKDTLMLIKYIAAEDKMQKVLENQSVLILPIVRNDIPIRMTGNGCILRPGFMKMDLKKKALRILRHIYMKPERMVLFLVTNTSATIWCRPSILQMNRLRLNKIAARWPARAVAQFYFIDN